ncbi:MAG: type II secretion system F family protein [Coleofasciculus chthonoplastes F3-SA18-01]|uniref:type II secretion system F family protein n=1 Tax=Coleofasciculus chthonoplastes TaxID=64178 RepID=UPI0032F6E8D9
MTNRQNAQIFSQLAKLLNSGISLQQSLTLVGNDLNPAVKRYLQKVSLAVGSGQDFATALTCERRYFNRWTISLIRLAEYSGSLPQTCQMLAEDAEVQARQERLYGSVKRSAIAIIWGFLVLTAAIFNPNATGIIKPEFWLRGLAIALLLWVMIILVSRFSSPFWLQLVRRLPIFGKIVQARSLLYLAKLRLPLSCGVSILTALDLLRDHIPDTIMKGKLSWARRRVRMGQPLSQSLQGKLPPTALQMISTGEESGTLDRTLETLAQHYDSELEQRLRSLQVSLRVLSLVVMGSLVAVVGVRGISVLMDSFPE